jgi:hypothetical protein
MGFGVRVAAFYDLPGKLPIVDPTDDPGVAIRYTRSKLIGPILIRNNSA